ncbi:MAG: ATP-binding protein [Bacteroidota bacterium]
MLLDLNTDTPGHRAGFRLHRLEVMNWGTFHQSIWSIDPKGGNGLLTGDIGSGKSTLVDAITTLLVPGRKIVYNKAAGAEGRERNLRTYIKGAYKNEKVSGSSKGRDVFLRPDNTDYSVLLAAFINEGTAEVVTLAQVFRMTEERVNRFYVIASKGMCIKPDFIDFGTQWSALKRRLRNDDAVEVFGSFQEYADQFRRRFGIQQEEALELFFQTVSMKNVGNLTEFVRERMLGRTDIDASIEKLVAGYAEATAAYDEVKKARCQIELLQPLIEADKKREKLINTIDALEQVRIELPRFFAFHRAKLAQEKLVQYRSEYAGLSSDLDRTQVEISDTREAANRLQAQLQGNEIYQQKAQLNQQIGQLEKERDRRRQETDRLSGKLINLDRLDEAKRWVMPTDAATAIDEKRKIGERLTEVEEQLDRLQHQRTALAIRKAKAQEESDELTAELESLRNRPTSIPRRQLQLRRRLCEALQLPEAELPFAGELLQVRENATDWEGAIERILRNFGLSILVADRHYKALNRLVNSQNLGQKLVYLRTLPHRRRPESDLHSNSLVRKVRIKTDSEHRDWLADEMHRRYDYQCCETLEEFRQAERALTVQGLSKTNRRRHVKDDGFDLSDRSRYILGWTNEAKIKALENRQRSALAKLDESKNALNEHQQQEAKQNNLRDLLIGLQDYPDFEQIDFSTSVRRIQKYKAELIQLESRSGKLKELEAQLDALKRQLAIIEKRKEDLLTHRGSLQNQVLVTGNNIYRDLSELGVSTVPPVSEEGLPQVESIFENFSDLALPQIKPSETLKSLIGQSELKDDIRVIEDKLTSKLSRRRDERARIDRSLIKYMGDFRHQFPEEGREMDADLSTLPDFRRHYQSLKRDQLPDFEQRFRQLLRENTIRGIVGFQNQLDRADTEIARKIQQINEHLHDIDYNPGSYITISREEVKTEDILDFKRDLKAALSDTFGPEGDEAYNERKFLEVKKLLDRFKAETEADARWTKKVTDVREWYNFGADEIDRDTLDSREYFSDSSGKSGGQKEKLAYTILASAIAFQFGLRNKRGKDRSFRFVVIDEAFGRGSDESTRYALRLFDRLNLQLLIVTPLQKINIIEGHIGSLHFVSNPEGSRSMVRNLTIEEYREERTRRRERETSMS